MENASKALIIAGSILLSILIIALGMYIFSTSSSTSNVEILDETAIQTYNSKFEKYKGTQLGSKVDSLMSALRTNVTSNAGAAEKVPDVVAEGFASNKKIENHAAKTVKGCAGAYIQDLEGIAAELKSSHNYTVTMSYDNTGLINKITIKY